MRAIPRLLLAMLILAAAGGGPAHAQQGTTPALCPLEVALAQLHGYNVQLSGALADQEGAILEQQKSIASKAKEKDKPLYKQLSKPDLDRFQELRFQSLTISSKKIAYSAYERDATVIQRMAIVAEQMQDGHEFKEGDPDYFYSALVLAMRLMQGTAQLNFAEPAPGETCSIDVGLVSNQRLLLKRLDAAKATATSNRLVAIANQYHLDPQQADWVQKLPEGRTQQEARSLWGDLQQTRASVTYLDDLEHLRQLNKISLLDFRTTGNAISAAKSEADLPNAMNAFITEIHDHPIYDQALAGLLVKIGEKVPSDAAVEAERLEQQAKNLGIPR
jgi:hypothetical protein